MKKDGKFRIPVNRFKRGYLEVPKEFAEEVCSDAEERSVILKSPDGARYPAIVNKKKRSLEWLGEWYRANEPISEESEIILEALDENFSTFCISLNPPRESMAQRGLFLGKQYSMVGPRPQELRENYYLRVGDLLTHAFICGVTGSGKTVLAKAMIEEAALKRIPCVLIDLKGDLSSMILVPKALTKEEFEPWVTAPDPYERKIKAAEAADRHKEGLEEFGVPLERLKDYREGVELKIFTPRSTKGVPISFSSYFEAPPDASQLYVRDREIFENSLRSLTDAFLDRLYPGTKRVRIENERTFIYEIVKYAWLHGQSFVGREGIRKLLEKVEKPPFDVIGDGRTVTDFIDAENRRNRLLNKITTLLAGPETMWFEGQALDMNLFLPQRESGTTPINVLNLSELDQFEDRSFVVAQVAHKIVEWMRRQPGTEEPRVLFFIDEIGGGGGKQALFPSHPYECAAKWGLNHLVRTGRSFGVCCVFATQNPGDIDYRALGNCGTWMAGRLATDRDRKKILEGMALSGLEAKQVEQYLIGAKTGDFAIKQAQGGVVYIRERWLLTYHRALTLHEVQQFITGTQA
jgi:hypothetical protein